MSKINEKDNEVKNILGNDISSNSEDIMLGAACFGDGATCVPGNDSFCTREICLGDGGCIIPDSACDASPCSSDGPSCETCFVDCGSNYIYHSCTSDSTLATASDYSTIVGVSLSLNSNQVLTKDVFPSASLSNLKNGSSYDTYQAVWRRDIGKLCVSDTSGSFTL